MKDKHNLMRSYVAKARQARTSAEAINRVLVSGVAKDAVDLAGMVAISDSDMAFVRSHLAQLNQAFHEMNAYRNTLLT